MTTTPMAVRHPVFARFHRWMRRREDALGVTDLA